MVLAAGVHHLPGVTSGSVPPGVPRSSALVPPTPGTPPANTPASDYRAAKNQWIGDAVVVSGAAQNTALDLAVGDLRRGLSSGAGRRKAYEGAIGAITHFAAIPITSVTPSERAQTKSDLERVDRFFGLRRLPWAKGCITSGPGVEAAAHAWDEEPAGITHGVLVAPLQSAAADLTGGLTSDHGDRSCDPAAVEDLEALESATSSQVAESRRSSGFGGQSPASLAGAEIAYLDVFFALNGSMSEPVLTAEG
jgi:hypothetical protein